jgi:hypothetical protein
MGWLGVSLLLSVVLTIVLNVAVRAFPGAGERLARRMSELAEPRPGTTRDSSRVKVFVPWKAMLIGSVLLTVLLNLVLWLR